VACPQWSIWKTEIKSPISELWWKEYCDQEWKGIAFKVQKWTPKWWTRWRSRSGMMTQIDFIYLQWLPTKLWDGTDDVSARTLRFPHHTVCETGISSEISECITFIQHDLIARSFVHTWHMQIEGRIIHWFFSYLWLSLLNSRNWSFFSNDEQMWFFQWFKFAQCHPVFFLSL